MRFANALETARSRRGLTQAALGERLGHTDGSVISKYERGEVLPHTATVAKIEEVLAVPEGSLLAARYEDVARRQGARPTPDREALREVLTRHLNALFDELEERFFDPPPTNSPTN